MPARRGDRDVRVARVPSVTPPWSSACSRRRRPASSRQMSSHREAPEISKDPVADNTDMYAFVSPESRTRSRSSPTTSRSKPSGGPNFFEFGDDVLYAIHIDNDGDGRPDIDVPVQVRDRSSEPEDVPVQHRTDRPLDSPNWNRRQFYNVSRVDQSAATEKATAKRADRQQRAVPAVQHRPALDAELRRRSRDPRCARARRRRGVRRSAQRGFFVDLGSIFDLGDLRPFQNCT